MPGYRASRPRIANVWAAPCEKCGAQTDAACRDLRGNNRLLFGRRTHKERAKAVRNLKVMETVTTDLPQFTRAMREYNVAITNAANAASTAFRQVGTAIQYTGTITANTAVYAPANRYYTTGGTEWTVTGDGVWRQWNNITTTTATAGTTIQYHDAQRAGVWTRWVGGDVTFTPDEAMVVVQQEMVWQDWNEADRLTREYRLRQDQIQEAREAESRRRHAEALAREERAAQAAARARELFEMLLTTEQRTELLRRGEVTVRGSEGGLFVIETNRRTVHGNVVEIDEHGCRLQRGCVQPAMYDDDGPMPTEDGWVGQLMAIRHDELALRRMANWSNRQGCREERAA